MSNLNAEIVSAIADTGCYIGPSIFSHATNVGLCSRITLLHEQGVLREAQIGRRHSQNAAQSNQSTDLADTSRWRGDATAWLEDVPIDVAELAAVQVVNSLRLALNATLYLGAFDTELHYARYPIGTFYKTHVDRFGENNTRVISLIFYLNPSWTARDGGELLLYDAEHQPLHRIAPSSGTMVAFLSERFPHEVLPTTAPRCSLTGWMRRRAGLQR